MRIDLMPFLIAWAVVTTLVVALAFFRLLEGLHDNTRTHVIEGSEQDLKSKTRMGFHMEWVELAGKVLTVLSVLMITAIGLAYLYYNVWLAGRG